MTEEGRPKRERKAVVLFNAAKVETKHEVSIVEGKGIQLGDFEYFTKNLEKHHGDSDLVKGLHALIFGFPGKKLETKKHLRQFSGFDSGVSKEEKISKLTENKKKWTTGLLKDALALFGLERGGNRDDLITRLIDYLFEPSVTKDPDAVNTRTSKKKGKKRKAGKKASSQPKKKRAPSAYILFCNDKRASVKESNPDATFGEMGTLLAKEWLELGEAEKEEYKAKAQAAKDAIEGEEEEDDEGEDGEGEEEEEDENDEEDEDDEDEDGEEEEEGAKDGAAEAKDEDDEFDMGDESPKKA